MNTIVIIADAWGPIKGGINAFNVDFAVALSNLLTPRGFKVVCVVADSIGDKLLIDSNLELIVLVGERTSQRLSISFADRIKSELDSKNITRSVTWWIGHDIRTGPIAARLKEITQIGKLALIHHMSYRLYKPYAGEGPKLAQQEADEQARLFSSADCAFGVGPLLRNDLRTIKNESGSGVEVFEIIPGLAHINPVKIQAHTQFSAITYGRLNPENDRVKQTMLGIDAFAAAVNKTNPSDDNKGDYLQNALRNTAAPALYAIGLGLEDKQEEEELQKRVAEKSDGAVNFLPLPYLDDRTKLFDQLRKSSVAMMLSWHDGFGLVGWEAIAAEVPLILSERCGLYQLIWEKYGPMGRALVNAVDIRGARGDDGTTNYHLKDLEKVRDAIIEVASNVEQAKKKAANLKALLLKPIDGSCGATWPIAAQRFAEDLRLIEPDTCDNDDDSIWAYKETALYASAEVKTTLLRHHATSFFAIDDSIRLIQLAIDGSSEATAQPLYAECRIPAGPPDIDTASEYPTNEELELSIVEFEAPVRDYLIGNELFKSDPDLRSSWKLGLQLVRPGTDGIENEPKTIVVRPLSYRATELFNRQLVRGRKPMLKGGKNLYPNLFSIYENCIKSLMTSQEIYKFPFPSQLFVELAVVTSDQLVMLVRKTAVPGSGVVADIKRAWTCGPEYGFSFKHLDKQNRVQLHEAIATSLKTEFGVEKQEISKWHIAGLCLQHIHLNAALYGYCEIALTGGELIGRFKNKNSSQFYMESEDAVQYPELIKVKDLPGILAEEKRHDGRFWHPTAKIRLHSLLMRPISNSNQDL